MVQLFGTIFSSGLIHVCRASKYLQLKDSVCTVGVIKNKLYGSIFMVTEESYVIVIVIMINSFLVLVFFKKQTYYQPYSLKGQRTPTSKIHIFLLPLELFISLDSFGVRCLVLEILAVKISAFSLI